MPNAILNFMLFFLERFGLWVGLMLIGTALLAGGLKFREHATYVPTQAKVVGLFTRCEMSYRVSRQQETSRMVDCRDVDRVKAGSPEVEWKVSRVAFVDLAYAVDGRAMRTTVQRGKLQRDTVAMGETIPVLRSPDKPYDVTGPASGFMKFFVGGIIAIGLVLFGLSRWAKQKRDQGGYCAARYA